MTTPFDELIDRDFTMKYDLDAQGGPTRMTVFGVLEAVVNGARRRAAVLAGDTADEAPLTFSTLGGHHLGRVVRDHDSMVTVAEMVLDEELAAGETAIFEQQMELDGDKGDTEVRYWAWPRVRSACLWVRFHPDMVPTRCEAFTIVDGIEHSEEISTYGNNAHRTITGFGPGTFGLRWFWEDDR